MSTRRILLAVLATSVAAAYGAAAASAAEDPCAAPITESMTLTADAPCLLDIVGSGITVDLGGHQVHRAVIRGDDVVLRNGAIGGGDRVEVFVSGRDAVLDRLRLEGGRGFAVEAGPRTTIRRSTFVGVLGVAADQYYSGGLLVEHSTFEGNTVGVSVQNGSDATIRRSRFVGNGTGVRVWDQDMVGADGTQILDNRFEGNGVGIRIDGHAAASGTVIRGNVVDDSAASGILVTSQGRLPRYSDIPSGAVGTVIERNTVRGSGLNPMAVAACQGETGEPSCSTTADDGITVLAPPSIAATMTLTRNTAIGNQGYGIEAPNVIDGGGNKARDNGAGACLGVLCG